MGNGSRILPVSTKHSVETHWHLIQPIRFAFRGVFDCLSHFPLLDFEHVVELLGAV